MQALQELGALLKKEDRDLQSWKSTSTKLSVVKWNVMIFLNSRREGLVREAERGWLKKMLSQSQVRGDQYALPSSALHELDALLKKEDLQS